MTNDWPQIEAKAAQFIEEWRDGRSERADAQSFWNDFFAIFGTKRRRVAKFEAAAKSLRKGARDGRIDVFWPGKMMVEHKSAGRDLEAAARQADQYLATIPDHEIPQYVIVTDFLNFVIRDLDTGRVVSFKLVNLVENIRQFAFMTGTEAPPSKDRLPVTIKAGQTMCALHDALEKNKYVGPDLDDLMVRLMFCFFSDGIGIFSPVGSFDAMLAETKESGSDVGSLLERIFLTLDRAENDRQSSLSPVLASLPYVNGGLFRRRLDQVPEFNKTMRDLLLEASGLDWSSINPAVYGSIYQHMRTPAERRRNGVHYTTVANIMAVIEPLFLTAYRKEFDRIRKVRLDREENLRIFLEKVRSLRIFDPACGCGNFLIVSYMEIRKLELDVLIELYGDRLETVPHEEMSRIDVNILFGIELDALATKIAQTAIWITDHLMNLITSKAFRRPFRRIPLLSKPNIVEGNALRIDWKRHAPLEKDTCVFLVANPPYLWENEQDEGQKDDIRRILGARKSGKTDYVIGWLAMATAYLGNHPGGIGLVTTNSIFSGAQAATTMNLIDSAEFVLQFARPSFPWESEVSKGKAQVAISIVGLRHKSAPSEPRLLFGGNGPVVVDSINGYLKGTTAEKANLTVESSSRPLSPIAPKMATGTQPLDGTRDHCIARRKDKKPPEGNLQILEEENDVHPILNGHSVPFIGAEELLTARNAEELDKRRILFLDEPSKELQDHPAIAIRLKRCKEFRTKSTRAQTYKLKDKPWKYKVNTPSQDVAIVIPGVGSERRAYIPVGILKGLKNRLLSNLVCYIDGGELWQAAILQSKMHMAWAFTVMGRMKTDPRYSVAPVYNTFPWPTEVTAAQKKHLTDLFQAILDARTAGQALKGLYDPSTMPESLENAHSALDRYVDKLYRKEAFADDADRFEHLFGLYAELRKPSQGKPAAKNPQPRQADLFPA